MECPKIMPKSNKGFFSLAANSKWQTSCNMKIFCFHGADREKKRFSAESIIMAYFTDEDVL
jgi:hypothetical protein